LQNNTTEIINFKGELNTNIINSLIAEASNCLVQKGLNTTQSKRVKFVMLEALQNMYNHAPRYNNSIVPLNEVHLKYEPHKLTFLTINHIYKTQLESIINHINTINNACTNKLHHMYLSQLKRADVSENCGAGLGLIEIVRRTKTPIEIEIQETSNKNYSLLKLIFTFPLKQKK
jgi:hypothetical protein